MKEFTSQTGGRHTYIDDIINLQDLSLAFSAIFDDCDNFIISGCQVNGSSISSGYVYLNGKVRYCSGASAVSKFPVYIYESDSKENVSYADSNDKVGRNVYGCQIGTSIPVSTSPLTGESLHAIIVASDGTAVRLKDAFFGKYSVLHNATNAQTINSDIELNGLLTASKMVKTATGFQLSSSNKTTNIQYGSNGSAVIDVTYSDGTNYQLMFNQSDGFKFIKNATTLVTIDSTGVALSVGLTLPRLYSGNLCITGNAIYDAGTASNNGVVNINMVSYRAGATYYRSTQIGDGKGVAVLAIEGSTHKGTYRGAFTIQDSGEALTLKHSSLAISDQTLADGISWTDKDNNSMGYIGYLSGSFNLNIKNLRGDVSINNNVYVTGSLYVGGADIAATYITKTTYEAAIALKANTADVYSKTNADSTFVKKTDGIAIFVTQAGGGTTGQEAVRNAIGAGAATDINKAALKDQLLSDMVSNGLPSASDSSYATALANRKRQICSNIGAAYAADITTNEKDTGWITMTVQNCGITTQLYVRQIGHVVSIQGKLHTHHSGTIFTLPNSVDPPKYEVGYSHNRSGNWHCIIEGGSRDCKVDYCNSGCSEYIGFLITYIV